LLRAVVPEKPAISLMGFLKCVLCQLYTKQNFVITLRQETVKKEIIATLLMGQMIDLLLKLYLVLALSVWEFASMQISVSFCMIKMHKIPCKEVQTIIFSTAINRQAKKKMINSYNLQ